MLFIRVKSGIFGQTAKFGQPPSLYRSSIIEIKNKLTKQTVKILMRRVWHFLSPFIFDWFNRQYILICVLYPCIK